MKKSKIPLTEKKYYLLFGFLTMIFLMWGLALTMMDVLNKHFQSVLHISKSKSAMIQFSTFGAYAVMALPVGHFMKKFGYKNAILFGLFLYAIGALLFVPAANAMSFNYFLLALFVLASGLATLETVAHPFIASLGDHRTSDLRINFAQSFNGLGGVIGPAIGSFFLLKAAQQHVEDLTAVKHLYITICLVICMMAILLVILPVSRQINHSVIRQNLKNASLTNLQPTEHLFKKKHFSFAVIAQFFNVAAQGGTWAYFINYGHEIMHFSDEKAGYFFSLSIFLLMIGRFAGTFLMRYIVPYKLLAFFAFSNIIMCLLVAQGAGWLSYIALLFINFFFSIMYPTIFSLGLKNMGTQTQKASSYIVMGVVGGAFFPPIMGLIADHDIAKAYYLPILCYLVILLFGLKYPVLNKASAGQFEFKTKNT
ncbi:L-fucose:H+ symporter permease [Arachidicoccus soli]|uniref:L-fucose:H+ symporter permease n=1 Tax=Arachidicoccus soli TaxID=2341117 RepID=A0A386HPJ7_9BACT|nr:L-fucose:H+ symporter permease [Arachidicoccus soli]AYD47506.1 L-fucose:H+ symporter permease [Arachidicoccus soli]